MVSVSDFTLGRTTGKGVTWTSRLPPGELGEVPLNQVANILNLVTEWFVPRHDRVAGICLTLSLEGWELYVVGRAEAFDFNLNRELAELVVNLNSKGFPLSGDLLPASSPLILEDIPGPAFSVNLVKK